MRGVQKLFSLTCAALLCACASNTDDTQQPESFLDPSAEHYGQTYAQWAGDWVNYIYRYTSPLCHDPVNDVTGTECQLNQDPQSPVFFLVGTYGGVARRTECAIAGEKALFFPLMNSWADRSGLAPDQMVSDAEFKASVEAGVAGIIPSSLHLTVDGKDVGGLERGKIASAPDVLHIAPAPNSLTCKGQYDVGGDFPGYVGGYFVMLAPLGSGAHVISFGATGNTPDLGERIVDVQYEYTAP
jgi:hypothetical protein